MDFHGPRVGIILETYMIQVLREQDSKMLVVAGGVIPKHDYDALMQAGCAAIFGPGTVIPEAAKDLLHLLTKS